MRMLVDVQPMARKLPRRLSPSPSVKTSFASILSPMLPYPQHAGPIRRFQPDANSISGVEEPIPIVADTFISSSIRPASKPLSLPTATAAPIIP